MPDVFREIELRKIRPSRFNPRLEINVARLNELASSIREVGLLEPIIVRPVADEYEVVVGERRYRASQQLGLQKIPVLVREYSDEDVVQINLVENIHREELSAIEKGKVCKHLLENSPDKYPSQMAIAEKIGVSANAVSLWIRTIEVVPQEAQRYVAPSTASGHVPDGKIDYLTAVQVGRAVKKPEKRVEIIRRLAEKPLTVKDRAQLIKKMAQEPEKPIEAAISEVTEAPTELQFTAADRRPLVDGTKTQCSLTSAPDPKLKVGAKVYASIFEPQVAELQITSVERKRLRYFDEEDAKREGGYTLKEFKEAWKKTHCDWDESQLVYIIHFKMIPASLNTELR